MPQFDEDREEVFARMREKQVGTIAAGVSFETSVKAVAFAQQQEEVLGATVGVHPTDTHEAFLSEQFEMLLGEHVVAVGECGFDFYRTSLSEAIKRQYQLFEAQVAFAIEHNLPLMLHVRPSEGTTDAHEEVVDLLRDRQFTHGERVRGNIHFFTGSAEIARQYLDIGFKISFPGVITFAEETHDAVRAVPRDMLLVETDAPYATPVPYRGKRNEPSFVVETLNALAAIRNEEASVLREEVRKNTHDLFGV